MSTPSRILGVDPHVDHLTITELIGGVVATCRTIRRGKEGNPFPDWMRTLCAEFKTSQNWQVYIEGIYLAQHGKQRKENVQAFASLAAVQGEVGMVCRYYRVPLTVVPPTTWMSEVLGITRGREEIKAASMEQARRLWAVTNEHEADSVCLAVYGYRDQHYRRAM
jgi:hypothetical protein